MRLLTKCLAALTLVLSPAWAHEDGKLPIGAASIGGDFEFLDDDGRLRSVAELQGNVLAVYFGFTDCPDACPAFMAKASAVRVMLGDKQDKFKVLFVTIDPERDDRQTLKEYLRLFGEGSIGARIPNGHLAKVLQQYAVSNQRHKDKNDRIVISHHTGAFLIDKLGRTATYVSDRKSSGELAMLVEELIDA